MVSAEVSLSDGTVCSVEATVQEAVFVIVPYMVSVYEYVIVYVPAAAAAEAASTVFPPASVIV